MIEYRPLRIALLGAGSVGSQVARLIIENKAELAARVGAELELAGVFVRDKKSARNYAIPQKTKQNLLPESVQSLNLLECLSEIRSQREITTFLKNC